MQIYVRIFCPEMIFQTNLWDCFSYAIDKVERMKHMKKIMCRTGIRYYYIFFQKITSKHFEIIFYLVCQTSMEVNKVRTKQIMWRTEYCLLLFGAEVRESV